MGLPQPPKDSRRVGFAGVGLMGHGLARQALEHGYTVSLLLRSPAARERNRDLLEAGATVLDTAGGLAAQCDVVIICVTGSPQVEEVVFGPSGLLSQLRPGTVVVDCSTSLPESSRRIAAALEAAGAHFLDAALTGTPKEAEEGQVNLLVGGDTAVLNQVRDVLSSFSRQIYECGGVGAGHSVKLLHQFVVLSNAAVLAEAFSCAQKTGVNLQTLCGVIGSGGANSTAFQRLSAFVAEGNDQLFRFSLANALKDMQYYTRMASDAQVVSAVAGVVHNSYAVANNVGLGERYVPHLIQSLNKMNGNESA